MDAILISWKPEGDEVKEIINHLAIGREYYWRLKFRFSDKKDFDFPVLGYVHMKGGKVEYKVTIQRIIPFSSEHYKLVPPVIPESWIREWNENPDR